MAQFTITIPDALVPRIQAAFNEPVIQALKTYIRQRVISFELDGVIKDNAKIVEEKAKNLNQEVW